MPVYVSTFCADDVKTAPAEVETLRTMERGGSLVIRRYDGVPANYQMGKFCANVQLTSFRFHSRGGACIFPLLIDRKVRR